MTEPTLGGMIPAPLAAALRERGYDDLTPVQRAVLAPDAAGRDLLAECRILKLGRSLAVGECLIFSEGASEPAARCSMTYSIPPKQR